MMDSKHDTPVILITGKSGQVGWELQRTMMGLGVVVAIDVQSMDLSDPDSIIKTLRKVKPNIIINAAAYTTVDQAEEQTGLAMKINGIAPGILAEEAKRQGALLVHYSTDYVFNGTKQTAYLETDQPCPLNVYGTSKLAGEKAIQDAGGEHLMLRTSWVYAARGRNFLLTMLNLMKERESLRIIDDQQGTPTWARLIAETSAHVIRQSLNERRQDAFQSRIYHLTASGATSWYGFAKTIAEIRRQQIKQDLKIHNIEAIRTEAYPTPAKRPMNSQLNIDRLEQHYGLKMPPWDVALRLCMADLP